MTRLVALLLSALLGACTTVGPTGSDEQWRVVSWPRATVATSFGATCRTPCYVRIPEHPFEITVELEGHRTWAGHYDPAQPNSLQELARAPDREANAAAGAVLAGGEMVAAGGGLAGAAAIGGAAALGALPWMLGPRIRRLEVRLQPDA
jgi:hypothetical protein